MGAVRLVEEEEAAKLGPGLVAFTIVVLLAIATFFLIKSMIHHINKVPPTFDDPDDPDEPKGEAGTTPTSAPGNDPKG